MDVKISFKDFDHEPHLDEKVHERSEKLSKLFGDNPTHASWNFSIEEGNHHCEAKFVGPKFEYHASGHSDNFYKTLDLVAQKIEKQAQKKHDKWKDHKHSTSTKKVVEDAYNKEEKIWNSNSDDF